MATMDRVQFIALASIVIGIVVLSLKYLAFLMTGSVALYSDALESIVNVVTAVVAAVAVRTSGRPADKDHPYGHGKAEYFSAVIVGVFIVVAAILILHEAWQGIRQPKVLNADPAGLMVNGVAGLINAAWCWVLISQGRRLRSPALTADGRHLLTDVVSSGGVLVGVLLASATGWPMLDPALAAVVALNILWAGWKLMSESVGGLMDKALPESELDSIRALISANAEGAIEAHDLRSRMAGKTAFLEFHLVVPGSMSVVDAHGICDRLEQAIRAEVGHAQITIHVEPDNKAKHSGIVVL